MIKTKFIKECFEKEVFEKIEKILKNCDEPVEFRLIFHKNGIFEAILNRDYNWLTADATNIKSLNRELEKIFKKIK